MDLATAVQTYGYPLVFLGTFLEGETILLLAGFAAHLGYLDFTTVALIALAASFLGDQLYFYLGRRYGIVLLRRWPSLKPRIARFTELLHRHHTPIILSIRFLYGLRIAGPIALGLTGIPWQRYLLLNFIGAVVWALLITTLGYEFGHLMQLLMEDLYAFELYGFFTLLVLSIAVWLFSRYR